MLDGGRYVSISEMAAAEKLDRGYLGRILRLALLAPDLVEHVLGATRISERSASRLLDVVPVNWEQQRCLVGATRDASSA